MLLSTLQNMFEFGNHTVRCRQDRYAYEMFNANYYSTMLLFE